MYGYGYYWYILSLSITNRLHRDYQICWKSSNLRDIITTAFTICMSTNLRFWGGLRDSNTHRWVLFVVVLQCMYIYQHLHTNYSVIIWSITMKRYLRLTFLLGHTGGIEHIVDCWGAYPRNASCTLNRISTLYYYNGMWLINGFTVNSETKIPTSPRIFVGISV